MAVVSDGAMLCDFAAEYGGRLTIAGAYTNLVFAERFPAMHQMHLVIRVGWTAVVEAGSAHHLAITVAPERGRALAELGVDMLPTGTPVVEHPEIQSHVQLVVPLVFQINQLGMHRVRATMDGDTVADLPFKVITPPR